MFPLQSSLPFPRFPPLRVLLPHCQPRLQRSLGGPLDLFFFFLVGSAFSFFLDHNSPSFSSPRVPFPPRLLLIRRVDTQPLPAIFYFDRGIVLGVLSFLRAYARARWSVKDLKLVPFTHRPTTFYFPLLPRFPGTSLRLTPCLPGPARVHPQTYKFFFSSFHLRLLPSSLTERYSGFFRL